MGDLEAYENNGVDEDNRRVGKVAGTLMFRGFRSSTG